MDNNLYGPLELLIIQGSPFCNINCSYCYLPNRSDNSKLSLETVEAIFTNLFSSDIVRKDFTLCWHAGEPLTVSKEFYREAISIANAKNNTRFTIRNNVQTNATLINQEWCDFFKEFDFKVSVSIDGPDFINDRNRVNRKGNGTFKKVIEGIKCLKKNNIDFSVISVITDFTLDYADEFYSFFKSLNPLSVGLNVEEIENYNTKSSLFNSEKVLTRYKDFIDKLFQLYYTDNEVNFYFREFAQLENFVFKKDKFMTGFGQQTTPYKIISIDVNGNFSTFSPELLNAKSKEHTNFSFGNVYFDNLIDALKTSKFNSVYSEILNGVKKCKSECDYFTVCGGGTPSNKYSENGSFNSTVTNHCKFKFQGVFDVFFSNIEKEVLS
jgi:uncharacterized protein